MPFARARFLEIALPVPDISASLDFYRRLGFTELDTNDIRQHHYAAVTDGHVVIGLHGGGFEEPALVFVQHDLAREVRDLVDSGVEPDFARIAPDEFHEAGFRTPDGHLFVMIEAGTYSTSGMAGAATPLVGQVTGVILRATDPEAAGAWLGDAGFAAGEAGRYGAGPLNLAVEPGWPVPGPVIRLAGPIPRAALDIRGITPVRRRQGEVVTAPEGTWLVAVP
jgi:catechol 2,3-dioxygenase-like lactoylglutathione lyase family enzyme